MKRPGVFMLPPGWDASPSQGYPQHYVGTHLYTWVERSTVRVKCLAQEHNTMSPARLRTRTTRSGVEHTNHEATAPPTTFLKQAHFIFAGVFYYLLANIHPMYCSTIQNIQLIGIAKTQDMKRHGIDKMLLPFTQELNELAKV